MFNMDAKRELRPAETKKTKLLQYGLQCSLCLQTLQNSKLLKCTHSFCVDCLMGIIKEDDGKKSITCPECTEVTVVHFIVKYF